MPAAKEHFPNIEDFLGSDWLEAGCEELGSKISQMAATGFLDNSLETDAHPVHKIWYAEVLDKPLPSDLVIATGDYGVDHRLRRLHRSLTLEQLLRKPESTEGGRRVSVLRRQEGAPVLLG